MVKSWEGLDCVIKTHHITLTDLLEDEESLGWSRWDGGYTNSPNTAHSDPEPSKIASTQLAHSRKSLTITSDRTCCWCLPLSSVWRAVVRVESWAGRYLQGPPLNGLGWWWWASGDIRTALESKITDTSLQLKRMLNSVEKTSHTKVAAVEEGVKQPKIDDVPIYDGSIIQWRTLWWTVFGRSLFSFWRLRLGETSLPATLCQGWSNWRVVVTHRWTL